MIYGYARCSTNETKQDIDRQIRELKEYGAENVYHEFEHGDSAVKDQFEALMEAVQPRNTIIALEVSRLSRSTKQLCELIERVHNKAVCLKIIGSITIDCRNGQLDPMTEAFLKMAGVFSELELKMIRARVKSGMANAAAKGKKLSRPKATVETIPEAFMRNYYRLQNGTISKMELHKITGLSRISIDKYIRMLENQ